MVLLLAFLYKYSILYSRNTETRHTNLAHNDIVLKNDVFIACHVDTLLLPSILQFLHHSNSIYLCVVASSPTCLSAVQDGPTSIRLQWGSPWPPGATTGFRIHYYRALTGHIDLIGVHNNSYVLTGLHSNASYGIIIVGLSENLPSEDSIGHAGIHLGMYGCVYYN